VIHIRSDRKKNCMQFFYYLFCCAGALCTILEFYFICITGIRNLNLNLVAFNFEVQLYKKKFKFELLLNELCSLLNVEISTTRCRIP
jgi:hypothetical protein